jgi:peptidoglycan/xylan/chitin deacetylase (PgdA/CDA1 family)
MKNIFICLAIISLSMASNIAFSQVASPYQVGTWPEFKSCAISYTFDDGCSGQFTKAIPLFDEYGYKLTLFTITNPTDGPKPNWTNLQNVAKNGHEVANHSDTHINLGSATVDAQKAEIVSSQDIINSKITTTTCVTMATPYCAEGNKALCMQYFIAVRGCSGSIESKTPTNFNNVSSIICGTLGSVIKVKDFKTKADQASASKGWLVYLIHGIDNDGGYSPLSSDTLKAGLKYLKDNNGKFWVNTFGNVARYIKERNCAIVTETSATESTISVSVTDTLSNNETFNFPLTIRRPLPDGWSNATVTQNGVAVSDTVIEVNSVKYIQFDAIPDEGSVVISKLTNTGSELMGSLNNDFNIWYRNNELKFSIPASCLPNPILTLYDLKGSKLNTFTDLMITNRIGSVNLDRSKYKSGFYLLNLCDSKNTWSNKFTLTLQ